MARHETKTPYCFLPQPVAMDQMLVHSLLGRAVSNPYDPVYGAYQPCHPMKPRDTIDTLQLSSSDQTRFNLQSLTKLLLDRNQAWKGELSAAEFRCTKVLNAPAVIRDMLMIPANDQHHDKNGPGDKSATHTLQQAPQATNGGSSAIIPPTSALVINPAEEAARKMRTDYRQQVLNFLRKQEDNTLYIVTGFIACNGMTRTSHGIKFSFHGEYLVACSYLPLYLKSNQHAQRKFSLGGWTLVPAKKDKDEDEGGEMVVGSEQVSRLRDAGTDKKPLAVLIEERGDVNEHQDGDKGLGACELIRSCCSGAS